MTEEPISAKGAAREFHTDARTLRKFLRSDSCTFDAVGQGQRYEFTRADMRKLKKQFDKWNAKKTARSILVEGEADDNIEPLEIED